MQVKIISSGYRGFIGIGFQTDDVLLSRLPGWDPHSYGGCACTDLVGIGFQTDDVLLSQDPHSYGGWLHSLCFSLSVANPQRLPVE